MKKISFMIVAAGLLATSAITSCKKEAAQAPTTKSTTTNSNGALLRMSGHWVTYNGKLFDCFGSGNSCYELGPVVVTPKVYGDIAGAATSGNSGTVGTIFSSQDLQDLCDHMELTEVGKLQSGNYFITLNNENNTHISYIAGQSFPVTEQNMEFAFQIIK